MEDRFADIARLRTRELRLRAALRQAELELKEAVDGVRAGGASDDEIRAALGERKARARTEGPPRHATRAPGPADDLDAWFHDLR